MNGKELAAAMLASYEMEKTRAYLQRGRQFQTLDRTSLEQLWAVGFRAVLVAKDLSQEERFFDADAEFRLRELETPTHLVKEEIELINKKIDDALTPEVRERVMEDIGREIDDFEKEPRH